MANWADDRRGTQRSRRVDAMIVPIEIATKHKAKDRDGLYRRRQYWHYELSIDGKKRSFSTGTKDYNSAKKIRAEAIRNLEDGKLPTNSGRKRFEAVADDYIRHREATVS